MNKKKSSVNIKPNSNYIPSLLAIVLSLIIGFIIWQPALKNNLTNYDERAYITENKSLREINIQQQFSSFYMGNYHPLTMISYSVDYKLFGEAAAGFIRTNIILHLIFCLFVGLCAWQLSGGHWLAFLIAFFIACIHPTRVESVAWAAERKDVLYGAFLASALWVGILWMQKQKQWMLFLMLFLWILSCLSKGMAVVFPGLFLLTAAAVEFQKKGFFPIIPWLKLQATRWIYPVMILISLTFGIVAVMAQQEAGAVRNDMQGLPFIAFICYPTFGWIWYLKLLIWPWPLSAHYEYPGPKEIALWIAPLLMIGVLGGAWVIRKKLPELLFALLFYTISISIVLQILPVGKAIAADRYFYIAGIGFALAAAVACIRNQKIIWPIVAPLILLIGIWSFLTRKQILVWKDSISLWSAALEQNPKVPFILFNLGVSLEKTGDAGEKRAVELYQKALAIDSNYFEPYNNLGIILNKYQRSAEAVPLYYKAIKLNPKHSDTYNNLATALQALKKFDESIVYFNKSIEINPNNASPYNNLGTLYNELGRPAEATALLMKAAELSPREPRIRYNIGNLYFTRNLLDSAIYLYKQALQLDPNYADAFSNMGVVYFQQKNYPEAIKCYTSALQVNPSFRDAEYNLGVLYLTLGEKENARIHFAKANQLGHPGAAQWLK